MHNKEYADQKDTNTIDLEQLGLEHLTEAGSLTLSDLERTSFGKLFQSIPMPLLLVELPEPQIHLANGAISRIISYWSHFQGRSLYDLFRLEEISGVQRIISKLGETGKIQTIDAWIGTREHRWWVRLHFQPLRITKQQCALLLIEDLNHHEKVMNTKASRLQKQNALLRREMNRRVMAEVELKNKKRFIEKVLWDTIGALAKVSEMRDPYTAGHQRRVTQLARAISDKMDLPPRVKTMITLAAIVHDIGKVRVPNDVLSKPGDLDTHEFGILKRHPGDGYEVLRGLQFPWQVAEAVYQHHERLNGEGYPRGLKGDDIVLEARIIGVADVVEAMSSKRPHRPALTPVDATKEIVNHQGTRYDPKVVEACLAVFNGGFAFKEARSYFSDQSSPSQ